MITAILPYSSASQSAKLISETFGVPLLKTRNSRFKGHRDKAIMCWGKATLNAEHRKCQLLNNPETMLDVRNKLTFLRAMKEHDFPSVPFFTDKNDRPAREVIVARTVLNGSGGEGCIIVQPNEPLPDAPLYTVYKKKKAEYRVHFLDGVCFHAQQKLRKLDVPNPNWYIRSHDNGFTFASRTMEELPACVWVVADNFAERSQRDFSIDFGALDIIYNEHEDKAYILECNSAPGVEESTAQKYYEEFDKKGFFDGFGD